MFDILVTTMTPYERCLLHCNVNVTWVLPNGFTGAVDRGSKGGLGASRA